MKEWFKARNIWGAAIMALSDAEAGRLMKSLWQYTMTGEEPNLSGAEKAVMALILMTLCQDEERDAEISAKRASAGSIGGKQKQAKQANATFATEEEANEANAYNKNKNIDKEINNNNNKGFKKPTVEEVREYCRERGNNVDPEQWFDYYESKGWTVGKTKMKDWKASVRTWERNDFDNGRNRTDRGSTQTQVRADYSFLRESV